MEEFPALLSVGDVYGGFHSGARLSLKQRFGMPDINASLTAGFLCFAAAGLAAVLLGLVTAAADRAALRSALRSDFRTDTPVFTGRFGLGFKLAASIMGLVFFAVALAPIPMYFRAVRIRQESLLEGLHRRVSVALDGLSSNVRIYLPAGDARGLDFLIRELNILPEARYITITNSGSATGVFEDRVWATSDPDILDKIDTPELRIGVSRLADRLSPRLKGIASELNGLACSRLEGLKSDGLASRGEAALASLEATLNGELLRLKMETGSEPAYRSRGSVDGMSRSYIFFTPVLYSQCMEDIYFRGLIRMEVSIESILEQIALDKRALLKVIFFTVFIALAIGVFGALILSGFIIRPIRRLVSHVELLRNTDDISKLEGLNISIRSKDEFAALGSAINGMTAGLVRAAQTYLELAAGKEIQKKFIPLETDRQGNKMTTGYMDTGRVQFFGYYEGAKGVSGDYFDYKNLDGRYFAVIKCDVAGKGVPAALIMVQIAAMFLNYFKTWKAGAKGMGIEEAVYQINEFIEALDFKGRFAALTLAIFDSFTGLVHVCNAGDNIIRWFDASERKMKAMTLRESPAAGAIPNFLVKAKGGYEVQSFTLESGDILFLYTDGIEESKRKFRDAPFNEVSFAAEFSVGSHENQTAGQWDEEMGSVRVEEVINAVMNRGIYKLRKRRGPEGDVELGFDFTRCEGTVQEAVMALVSVEKVFRIYKPPSAGEETRILVDKKVDQFLKAYFLQYRDYCHNTRECPENNIYMYYTHVNEDAQYDDLTILGIKRK
ncbi:MAG: SpoIIE family protein phosphatase [Treponema sp.]|nr:SpoIIE family protein phosphatase [Treponema sp.]